MQASMYSGAFFIQATLGGPETLLLTCFRGDAARKTNAADASVELAQRITEALARERVVPRFVDSSSSRTGRHAVQVHASLYRGSSGLCCSESAAGFDRRTLAIVATSRSPRANPKRVPCCGEMPRCSAEISGVTDAAARLDRGRCVDFQRDLQV